MTAASQEELIARYLAAYNAFDVDGMLALLSPAVRFENYDGDKLTAEASGIDEFRQLADFAKSLFSEREQRITALDCHNGVVTAQVAYRGKLAVDIPDGPKAGTVINLQGQSEFAFENAKIARIVDRS